MLIRRTWRINIKLSSFQGRRFYSDLKILYFGTDNFSLPSLKLLSNENLSRLEVVTSFRALNNPIKAFAESNQIQVHDWKWLKQQENLQLFKNFDLGLVVSFGHLIPEEIITGFRLGMLNVHASLLPKYRGASPIIYAIRNGEVDTGVSIMRIKPKKFDVGEILATQRVKISEDTIMPELHEKLSEVGAELLIKSIKNLDEIKPVAQDDSIASYAPKIDNEFCQVRWNEATAKEVYNLYRSIYSFKHMLTSFKGEPVKIIEISRFDGSSQVQDLPQNVSAGHLIYCKKSKKLLVKCADENFIEIKKLSIGKKKVMSSADFNNGFLKKCAESERQFR